MREKIKIKYDSEENESGELEEQEEAIEIDDMKKKNSLEDIYENKENKYKSKELDLICKF
jgi:hypothetical protein